MQQFKNGIWRDVEDVLKKVGKACQLAFAECHVLDNINQNLLDSNRRKDNKKDRATGNDICSYTLQTQTRVTE